MAPTEWLFEHIPSILQSIASVVLLWGWWSLKRVFVTQKDFEAWRKNIGERIGEIEDRHASEGASLQQLETRLQARLEALPTSAAIHNLSLSIKEVEGDIKGLRSEVAGLARLTSKLEKTLDMLTEVHLGGRQ